MAAYAALVSLMNNMEQIQNHPRLSTSLDKYQIESLGENVGFFLDFIESYNSHGVISKEAENLESQIASAAHEAEDVIESHIVDQIHAGSNKKSLRCLLDLQKIIVDMDSIKEKVMKVKEEKGFKDQRPIYSMPAASSKALTTGKTTMVGFEGYLTQLLDGLTGQQSDRQIIPIVGMGGIGKTTLARNVYENLLIMQHFDVRAWATISQKYSEREILFELFSCQGKSTSGTIDELGEQLHKKLSGRRYLIILDDMWSIEVWDKMKFFFPDNNNRSRIIVTTRLSTVANHLGSLGLAVNFLDDNKSWSLFCEKVFADKGCPPELEQIGKKIVKKCKGLPLSIVVIGGFLGKSPRTQVYWEYVAKDISSILNSREGNQCLNILSLSYNHLPACLKPCFLYLGIFPEDHEIRVSRLVKLWVAEGFLKSNKDQSLEEVAEGYVKDLIDRNLILVHRLRSNGKFKTCKIHDLLRDLCLKVAEKEKFLCVMRVFNTPRHIDSERRIVIRKHNARFSHQQILHILESTSLVRSLSCEMWDPPLFNFRLLRVLFEVQNRSPDDYFQKVNLRFMAPIINSWSIGWMLTYKLPSSISLLWNVQTIICRGDIKEVAAPPEIWEMPQLRHLEFKLISLPDPPLSVELDDFVLLNLQTLVKVLNFRYSEEVYKRMPNIQKLHIIYDDFSGECETRSCYCLYYIGRLNKLESLYYHFIKAPNRDDLLKNLTFPSLLKKLALRNCKLHWNDLALIGSLPHLEVLKLFFDSVVGPEWNPVEGEFLRLKVLGIYWCADLIYWNADNTHFPVLEKLVLRGLYKLDEIPSGIGEIPTLEGIYVFNCRFSAAISAMKILEEQESLGNQGLQVQVEFSEMEEQEEFREKVKLEGLTSQNFQRESSL